jgi:hypothetical protein
MTPLHSMTLPNAVTDYVVFLPRILEIPRRNPGPGISWLRISVVLRTPFVDIWGLYCSKLLKIGTSFRAFPFHCHNIRRYTVWATGCALNKWTQQEGCPFPANNSRLWYNRVGGSVAATVRTVVINFYSALYLPKALHLFVYCLLTYAFRWHRE